MAEDRNRRALLEDVIVQQAISLTLEVEKATERATELQSAREALGRQGEELSEARRKLVSLQRQTEDFEKRLVAMSKRLDLIRRWSGNLMEGPITRELLSILNGEQD